MPSVGVTSRGQVTLRKEILDHLGIKPGDRLEVELRPGHRASLSVSRRKGTIDDFIGILKGKTDHTATIEEINEATAKGWAGLPE